MYVTRALPSYMYRDPAEALDRKRAEEAARTKRKPRPANGLTEEDLKYVPKHWFPKTEPR